MLPQTPRKAQEKREAPLSRVCRTAEAQVQPLCPLPRRGFHGAGAAAMAGTLLQLGRPAGRAWTKGQLPRCGVLPGCSGEGGMEVCPGELCVQKLCCTSAPVSAWSRRGPQTAFLREFLWVWVRPGRRPLRRLVGGQHLSRSPS